MQIDPLFVICHAAAQRNAGSLGILGKQETSELFAFLGGLQRPECPVDDGGGLFCRRRAVQGAGFLHQGVPAFRHIFDVGIGVLIQRGVDRAACL